MIAWLAILVGIVGILIYFISTKPKVEVVGKLMFFVGLLVTVWSVGGKMIRIP